jgi:hypothetical protein
MRPKDTDEAARIDAALTEFHNSTQALPGIQSETRRAAFLEQLIESQHRVQYIARIRVRDISSNRSNPASDFFDPIKAAALRAREANHDDACWLVYLSVHFGRHQRSGWRYCRDIYGALGGQSPWDWGRVSADPDGFRRWLATAQQTFETDDIVRAFGNHRKYESIDANSPNGTGAAIASYVRWVSPPRTHAGVIQDAINVVGPDRRLVFDHLYQSLNSVTRFGRTAKFDYLTMLGKLQLAPIEPGSPYLVGATGPLRGSRLLFLNNATATTMNPRHLDALLVQLGAALQVGMQELEDSLCNWQKNPDRFVAFRG